ncbi:mannan-binding lectin serine protease 2-like [Ylistrum balloti]|uniref:mannan-binding lectin serine protease 2-like n=1 Tax=Ylistrum balloti TaxID=509963 RepID=UPI002905B8DD|nr:mannan-binding lectin serine protease 2-like [Ylistrum balloti]
MASLFSLIRTGFVIILSYDAARKTVKFYITVGTEKQYLTSPNYPQPYRNVLTYEWYLTANSSIPYGVIKFKVLDSRIRDATPCYEEAVVIYNGPNEWSPELASWCGYKFPSKVLTTVKQTSHVVFTSSAQHHSNPGFRIEYWATSKPPRPVKPVVLTLVHYTLFGVFVGVIFILLGYILIISAVRRYRQAQPINPKYLIT